MDESAGLAEYRWKECQTEEEPLNLTGQTKKKEKSNDCSLTSFPNPVLLEKKMEDQVGNVTQNAITLPLKKRKKPPFKNADKKINPADWLDEMMGNFTYLNKKNGK